MGVFVLGNAAKIIVFLKRDFSGNSVDGYMCSTYKDRSWNVMTIQLFWLLIIFSLLQTVPVHSCK